MYSAPDGQFTSPICSLIRRPCDHAASALAQLRHYPLFNPLPRVTHWQFLQSLCVIKRLAVEIRVNAVEKGVSSWCPEMIDVATNVRRERFSSLPAGPNG